MNNKINVFVKKWFDNVNGNTYHNVNFNYNNKNYNSGLTYGYGSQYKVTLRDMIEKHNLTINDDFNYIVIDVNTEEELEKTDYFTQI